MPLNPDTIRATITWHRGEHTNWYPTKQQLKEPRALESYFLKGWLPPRPFIAKSTPVMAVGSCFASHISGYLLKRGFTLVGFQSQHHDWGKCFVVSHSSGMNTTFAMRQQFEWALEGRTYEEDLWFDEKKTLQKATEEVRLATRDLILASRVFVFTLGLSEIWRNRETGGVFWRAIPQDCFDPKKHYFEVSSVADNTENLEVLYRLIRKHIPESKVILTLSPVPLVATFRNKGCVGASEVSKAILRVAIDKVYKEHEGAGHLFYWPSYEIIKHFFSDPYEEDNRHPRASCLDTIMKLFEKHYTTGG